MSMTVKRTYRLDAETLEMLGEIAAARECSQTDAIRFAIHSTAETIHGAIHEEDENDGVTELLAKQLEVKDGQIAALESALAKAQDTAHAAQVLHAQERKALESEEQKRSRWQRLVAAWRG